MSTEKNYIKVTLADIYHEIQNLKQQNTEQHEAICQKQIFTNGKVKLSMWIGTTALSLSLIAIGFILKGG